MFSHQGELVLDPFAGSGTTIVEGLLLGRRVLAIDINPVSYLICKAKTISVHPDVLNEHVLYTLTRIKMRSEANIDFKEVVKANVNYRRIRYWFNKRTINDLALILSTIDEIEDDGVRTFLECGFSHILKNCSRWLMNSVKPQRKRRKRIPKVIPTFERHIQHMARKYKSFHEALPKEVRNDMEDYAKVYLADCRDAPQYSDNISLILTSPPYVTSYEYANIHQLTYLWLEPSTPYLEHRKKFIGTKRSKEKPNEKLRSEIGKQIINELKENDKKNGYARAVYTYFAEMQQAIQKFKQTLKPGGVACFVIGDTRLAGVDILNAEVLTEMCMKAGYELETVIKRKVPSNAKFLPSVRDPNTGAFSSIDKDSKVVVYPHEFILVFTNPR